MTRHLAIVERQVAASETDRYLSTIADRQSQAKSLAANFWVFAHASDSRRFVEFVEGADASDVSTLSGVEPAALWRAIEVK